MMARDPSVDPSSTTTTSSGRYVWASALAMHAPRNGA
jgi:hypothetical protein